MRRAHHLLHRGLDRWARFRLRSSSYGGQVALPSLRNRVCRRHLDSQTRLLVLAADFARALLHLRTLKSKRAQGRPGADIAPAVRCANCTRTQKTAQQHTGGADHSAFPARWSDGLCRGLTGTTRPARAISCRRCRVHRNPARVSNDSRTAPLRQAGLFRCMPQFRISVKWNIFAQVD